MAHGNPAPLLDWARWNGRSARESATSQGGRPPIWERYQRFMKDNPAVLEEALNLARAELAAGATRIGAKALWERLRGRMRVKTGGKLKLDNDYTALLARDLIAAEPKLAGKIELRERKTAIDKAVDETAPITERSMLLGTIDLSVITPNGTFTKVRFYQHADRVRAVIGPTAKEPWFLMDALTLEECKDALANALIEMANMIRMPT